MLRTAPPGMTLLGGVVMVAVFSLNTKADWQPAAPNLLLVLPNFQLPISGLLPVPLQPPIVGIDKLRRATRNASLGCVMGRADVAESLIIEIRPFGAARNGYWIE